MSYTPQNLNSTARKAYQVLCANLDQSLVIRFKKRTNGEIRRMVCITYSHIKGQETAQTKLKNGLFQVWDIEKGAIRHIPLENIQSIKRVSRMIFTAKPAPKTTLKQIMKDMESMF